jgi:hypothetical protein
MDKNPFEEIDRAKADIPLQQVVGDKVAKRNAGRPPRPNMVRKLIKVGKTLYAQISALAQKNDTTIASLISQGLRKVVKDDGDV